MSDVFVSYARGDRPRAEVLASALAARGWSVWWDRAIPAGTTFDEVIEKALQGAGCVIVLWSRESVASRWVRAEAEEGAARGVLVPVLIEEARIPLAFRSIQTADLTGWDGAETAEPFERLVADVSALLGAPPPRREERPQRGRHPRPWRLVAAGAGGLAFAGVLAWDGFTCGGLWDAVECAAVSPAGLGTLVLTALPWAEVSGIVDATGREFPVPADSYTPLRLSLPAGTYTITLANPRATRTITVDVAAARTVERTETLTAPDPDAYFRDAGW